MDVTQLIAIEEIKRLKARYFRYIDTKQWDALRDLFTEDASLSFAEINPAPYDRAGGIAMIRDALSQCVTVHHGHMPEIEIESADVAHGIWAMEDILHWTDAGQRALGRAFTQGWGHYHESYCRFEGQWLIHTLRLSRLRVESLLPPIRIP
jgi:hypothetical protein